MGEGGLREARKVRERGAEARTRAEAEAEAGARRRRRLGRRRRRRLRGDCGGAEATRSQRKGLRRRLFRGDCEEVEEEAEAGGCEEVEAEVVAAAMGRWRRRSRDVGAELETLLSLRGSEVDSMSGERARWRREMVVEAGETAMEGVRRRPELRGHGGGGDGFVWWWW